MAATPLPQLTLYTRPGCGLCAEAHELLTALLAQRASNGQPAPTLTEIDIDTDPALERRFFTVIPVVEIGERRLELATSAAKLRRLLSDALDA